MKDSCDSSEETSRCREAEDRPEAGDPAGVPLGVPHPLVLPVLPVLLCAGAGDKCPPSAAEMLVLRVRTLAVIRCRVVAL